MRHIEENIQKSCVQWFRLQYPRYVLLAVPNGGSRNYLEAVHMKATGTLAGASDLIAVFPHHLLFIEMKTPQGRQSPAQKEFERRVTALGFEYHICRSLEQFAELCRQAAAQAR